MYRASPEGTNGYNQQHGHGQGQPVGPGSGPQYKSTGVRLFALLTRLLCRVCMRGFAFGGLQCQLLSSDQGRRLGRRTHSSDLFHRSNFFRCWQHRHSIPMGCKVNHRRGVLSYYETTSWTKVLGELMQKANTTTQFACEQNLLFFLCFDAFTSDYLIQIVIY